MEVNDAACYSADTARSRRFDRWAGWSATA